MALGEAMTSRTTKSSALAVVLAALLCTPADSAPAGAAARPNVLVILADDLGYSDLGAFGGEIDTPNLDRLARRGTKFTSMYATPACSPSRAELLTGRDHHSVGLGGVPEALSPLQRGRPGYEGYLLAVPTLAERFLAAGYFTAMAGKWDVGGKSGHWPVDRGFTESFALLGGAANYFGADQAQGWEASPLKGRYVHGRESTSFPANTYATDYYADRLIGFLRHRRDSRQPFFAYLAFTAPHWPLQAPEELVAKYVSRYSVGPGPIREARLARMRAMRLLPVNALDGHKGERRLETSMSSEDRERSSRVMAVYAAMVESMDSNVGKVVAWLESTGELDNTVIMVMSDNGAEGVGRAEFNAFLSQMVPPADRPAILAASASPGLIGSGRSYATYGPEWAAVSAAPWRGYKGSLYEGGYRVPAFVTGPGVPRAKINHKPFTIRDVHSALLAIARAGEATAEGSAASLLGAGSPHEKASAFEDARELFFRRAIRRGKWKAVFDGDSTATIADPQGFSWRLYDLQEDPLEVRDLAASHPAILEDLRASWLVYARENGVVVP